MAPPMKKTRMIVVDDTFLADGYKSCKGERNPESGEKQVAWLHTQLNDARVHHERVWVMRHIPPGVSPYATFQQQKQKMNLCTAEGKPVSFMPTDLLGDSIVILREVYGYWVCAERLAKSSVRRANWHCISPDTR
jgi:sphingomyelin phosphodiesterase acid-like 3